MDSKPQTPRITDPSLPAGRRREIDNVMKKARASPNSSTFWDKKLLEVEAKDPNRWRHSGYKSMYMDCSSSPSPNRRSRSRSPQTGGGGRRSPRSPRSPPPTTRRSPVGGRNRSPRSPPPRRSTPSVNSRRSPLSSTARRSPVGRSPASRRSPPPSSATRSSRPRPRSPPPSKSSCRRSASASSMSSCSDDSCSVCSPKNNRHARSRSRSFSTSRSRPKTAPKARSPAMKQRSRPRPPSPSPSPPRRVPRPMTPPSSRRAAARATSSDKPTDPRRRPPPPPRPRNSTGEVINLAGVKPPLPGAKLQPRKPSKKGSEPVLLTKIKKEKVKRRPGSPGGESSASDDSSASSTSPIVATTRLTLSERFGKMAQWSVDRERRDIENMRITKTGGDLKVMIEQDDYLYGSPPRRYSLSPVPAGHYPDELLSSGPSRLAAWDDVRVRYQYYKDLGYLRDLTLDDYVKWEEWWYKYQDWLANERHYEHWLATQSRRRRKRIPATQRLN
ncbi:hypothetical protein Trydic_g21551 [Trypoxylus dichotomus]